MRRREFITLVCGAGVAWPVVAPAQQAGKPRTIGFLIPGTPAFYERRVAATVQRLSELGWVEGRTVTIEYRWAETQQFDAIAAEFVRLNVDCIFISGGTPPALAAKKASSAIPIVFVSTGDPVGSGLVASLARPGGNVTGVSNQTVDIASKRVGLFREFVPSIARLAVMANVSNVSATSEMNEVQVAAGKIGIASVPVRIRSVTDIEGAFENLNQRADSLYVVIDPLSSSHASLINSLALNAKLPTIHGSQEFVEAKGLLSYGANLPDVWRRGADYVDKILRGTKPADIPVEQPTKFDLVVNLTTARTLGLTVPLSLLGRADEVIE